VEGKSAENEAVLGTSFRAMFEAEFLYVCRSLRRCGIRPADVEDLTHDVFLAAHCGSSTFDPARPLKPWLFGITFRVASHHKRRAGYQREQIVEELESEDPSPGADVQIEARQRERLLLAALELLDDDRRAIVVMHDLDGLPMQEIATELGVPLFTGYSRLRTGREELAASVRKLQLRRASTAALPAKGARP
jgi:RNA polymerase sigma-70 factor (ECF subfamily)